MVIMMAMLVLLTLLSLAHAAMNCPIYTCASLDSNVCISYTSSPATFEINWNGCESDYSCSAETVSSWASTILPSITTSSLECVPVPVVSQSTTALTTYPCIAKNANKSFVNHATKVDCNSESDCGLVDGSFAECRCVMGRRTSGICIPDPSNEEVFEGYWEDCGSENTLDKEKSEYWQYYKLVWVYTQSSVSCSGIFSEIHNLSDLEDAKDGAAMLAVGVLGLLILHIVV